MTGCDAMLQDRYGKSPHELLMMMRQWQSRHAGVAWAWIFSPPRAEGGENEAGVRTAS